MMKESNEKMYNVVFCTRGISADIPDKRLCIITDTERTIKKGEIVRIKTDPITSNIFIAECLTDSELVNEKVLNMLGGSPRCPRIIGIFEYKPIDAELWKF